MYIQYPSNLKNLLLCEQIIQASLPTVVYGETAKIALSTIELYTMVWHYAQVGDFPESSDRYTYTQILTFENFAKQSTPIKWIKGYTQISVAILYLPFLKTVYSGFDPSLGFLFRQKVKTNWIWELGLGYVKSCTPIIGIKVCHQFNVLKNLPIRTLILHWISTWEIATFLPICNFPRVLFDTDVCTGDVMWDRARHLSFQHSG